MIEMVDLISVIVPVYKVEDYLDECVSSVVSQSHKNLEIILVDDGSPDSCPRMCDTWAEKDSRIRVIHKANGGLSDARNAGLEIASGDYIAFVDSDDCIQPDMLKKLLDALHRTDSDISACGILNFGAAQSTWGCQDFVGTPEQIYAKLYNETAYPVAAWNKLYRRRCWDTLRFPIGKICEDAFTTYRLIHNAKRIVMIPEALYCYRIRPESIMTSAFSPKRMDEEEAWRCNYQFIEQHYPKLRKAAFDFYLLKVNVLMHTIPAGERKKYAEQYRYLRNILAKNALYILFASSIRPKQRAKMLLEYFK